MKIKSMLLLLASFSASVAGAQTYTGTITASDYAPGLNEWAPAISYSITYQDDKHLLVECTVAEFNDNNVQLNLEDKGQFEVMNMVDGNNCHYSIVSKDTYEAGTEMNNAFFYLAYPNKASRANFKYVVGASNTEADTEAPTWASDPVASPRSTSVAISATANDNLTNALTYEVSATADFATIAATAKGIPGSAVELAVNGLTAGTDYTYYVRVKDAAGNVSEVKTITFTTTEGAAVVATYYGVFYPTDWEEKASVAGKDVTPKLLWQAETLEGYGDVVVKATLGEALPDGAALKFCAYIENGVGAVDNKDMTKVSDTEYTIQLSDVLPAGTVLTKDQIFGQFFFRIYPKEGGVSRTKILAAQYKVGASNDPIAEDVTAPVWNADPTTQNVTDKTVEIVVNLTDDSGNAVVTISGDNGFAETAKTVVANGGNQVISLNGLTAETTYNLTLAVKDGTGNVGESKNVSFTTAETPHLDVLYQTVDFVSGDWTKNGAENTFAPDGSIQIAVNADNTITMKVAMDEGADLVDNAQCILHGIDTFWLTLQDDNTFVGTSTNSVANRDASQPFHLNFVLKEGKGNSEFKVTYFTPSEGSTSSVADVVANDVKVVAVDGVIRVEGSQFAVYTLAGQQVYNGVGEARLDRGVYVVVVDGKAVKVML